MPLAVALPAAALVAAVAPVASAADPDPLDPNNYEKITITKDTGEPIDMAVMSDSRILHTARNGDVRLTDPSTGVTRIINKIDVYGNSEDGLQTVALDPNFATNKWVYLYYAPRVMSGTAQNGAPYPTTTPAGSAPNDRPAGADNSYWNQWLGYNQLSRFKWNDATQALDLTTEQVIIKVEQQRGQCCHVAGDIDWDAAGNLYLSTGDNTPASAPGASGMAPNISTPTSNPGHDDRRGAGNTNDLRGKILRIKVAEDGSYTVPAGNLFAPGTARTRPEIFVMGLRNPFRMEVDEKTNTVSWGDYGPDSGTAIANRGPMGYVEWQITSLDTPLNGGWPYCHGPNANYNEYNYATNTPGEFFDCAAGAKNNSPLNTGLPTVPPATAPQLWYGDRDTDQPWPELTAFRTPDSSGQAPMGGPIYHYDAANPSQTKFPAHWDNKAFMAEFSQDYVAALTVDYASPAKTVTKLENFFPNGKVTSTASPRWDNVMDMEFGPDGSLYVLEYGDGFFRQNPDAGLYRVDWAPGNKTPQAQFTATPSSSSSAPLTVAFDAGRSLDPEGAALTYEWDFNNDGVFDATGVTASYTYNTLGAYTARLRVADASGKTAVTSRRVSVGNQAPTISVSTPNGGFFNWGKAVPWSVTTNDAEEGTNTVCSRVSVIYGLGHNTHAHPLTTATGCAGAWATPADAPEHGPTENIYGVMLFTYTDAGANGVPAASGEAEVILNDKNQQAEWFDAQSGVQVTADANAAGFNKVTSFDAGDFIGWDPVNFSGITGAQVKGSGQGTLAFRWGSVDAAPFATAAFGAGEGWKTVNLALTGTSLPTGSGKLFVTSTGGVDVDQIEFLGNGLNDVTAPTVTATTSPAANGANGWWTSGNVTVTIAATDNGAVASRQYRTVTAANQCTAAGATWTNVPNNGNVVISAEGTTFVCYRATDNGGNVSAVGNVQVRIDRTAPTGTLPGVVNGSIANSAYLVPSATDTGGSGFLSVSGVTVDGKSYGAAQPIDLSALSLGAHTIVFTVKDVAGNTKVETLAFTTTVSFDSIDALIGRYAAAKTISASAAASLRDRLEAAETRAERGQLSSAISYLEQFIKRADSQVKQKAAHDVLVRDARALIASLEG
ncbi:PQQ-dependent sugar dehydrogenase [Motilibacter aurantiacus]|uniref:PQQ-dependent sugar dehydrogenase n=1 Tax=Motilibacter aurantiacus TaxID=2714955 RepID=UPI002F2B4F15